MSASAALEFAPPVELDDEAEFYANGCASPIDDVDDPVFRRLCRDILALSSAHAVGRPIDDVWPTRADRAAAAAWIEGDSAGFRMICHGAGVSHAFVRRTILKLLGRK